MGGYKKKHSQHLCFIIIITVHSTRGRGNFIIVPAGTVKTKLMNTESFLLRLYWFFTVLLLGNVSFFK